jgi:Ca2+-binding RTX toxin-like protein
MPAFVGTEGNDVYSGGPDGDSVQGFGGDDILAGGGGDDLIAGGDGRDTVDGGTGNDTLYSSAVSLTYGAVSSFDNGIEVDTIYGGDGTDLVTAGYGDIIDGGAGSDTLVYSLAGATSGITLNTASLVSGVTIGGGNISNIEFVYALQGSNFADTLTTGRIGTFGDQGTTLYGGGGNDTLLVDTEVINSSLYGEEGDDTLNAMASHYAILNGGTGNDVLLGGNPTRDGGDQLDGGDGNDIIRAFSMNDMLDGGNGNDILDGGSFDDVVTGGSGNDSLYGGGDADSLVGGEGDDLIYGDWSPYGWSNEYFGARGNGDYLEGGTGADMLYGDDGDDVISSATGVFTGAGPSLTYVGLPDAGLERDRLSGGSGNDRLYAGAGDDVDGSTGVDSLYLSLLGSTSGLVIDAAAVLSGAPQSFSGVITNIEVFAALTATNFDDTITSISGLAVSGSDGNDRLFSSSGADAFDGGIGVDTIDYRDSVARISLNLVLTSGQAGAGGDSVINVENIAGSAFNDALTGNNVANRLEGRDGNDILIGLDGDDILDGGAGANSISGGAGNDTLIVSADGNELQGGAGSDIYVVVGRTDTIIENANEGTDELRTTSFIYDLNSANNVENLTFTDNAAHAGVGNALANLLVAGTAADELQGRGGDDIIRGGAGAANTLLGGMGDDLYVVEATGDTVLEYANEGTDTVSTALSVFYLRDNVENLVYTGSGTFSGVGSADANTMIAGAGADFLNGNDGADILIGGSGADLLIGGNGADQFRYLGGESGYDRILDFTPGTDKIALSNLGFTHTATIAFIATGAPVATTANSTFLYDVNSGILSYDADGNGAGAAVQLAQLNTGLTLTTGDFIFV